MRKQKPFKKVMIIVWRWLDLKKYHVNEEVYHNIDGDKYLNNIHLGKGKFYEEYIVEDSNMTKASKVVAVSIYSDSEKTKALLHKVIEQYACPEADTMVFLHRANDCDKDDVGHILEKFQTRVRNCFLFGDGRDYIYYKTQGEGLLDDAGGFKIGRVNGYKVQVLNKQISTITQPHFDRVWQYYENEFEQKIFELKEDLFDTLFSLMLPDSPETITTEQIREIVTKANKSLFFRIKSFLGKYDELITSKAEEGLNLNKIKSLKAELADISTLEKISEVSFIFDDCRTNLGEESTFQNEEIPQLYTNIEQQLNTIFFDDRKEKITKSELRQLSEDLERLVIIVPGEID